MSQHNFKTTYNEQPVLVQAGWDKRYGGFHLTIIQAVEDDNERDPIYCNVTSGDEFPASFALFDRLLDTMGIVVPREMIVAVLRDGRTNAGSAVHWWTPDGRRVTSPHVTDSDVERRD